MAHEHDVAEGVLDMRSRQHSSDGNGTLDRHNMRTGNDCGYWW